jgi:hypothetical protein
LSTFVPSAIRFSIPVVPLSLFWAATGILEIKRYLEKVKISNPEKAAFLLIFVLILSQLPQDFKPERTRRADQKKVGQWLQQNTSPDAIIMSNSPQETFYADRRFIPLPPEPSRRGTPGSSYRETIRYARTRGVRYILVDRNTHETNQDFVESVENKDLKEFLRKADQQLIIYEVVY